MLRQDANIKSTILEDNFLLPHIFLKIIFMKQIYSHGHTELQHEVSAYNNTSHEVEIMTDKNNIRQWTTMKDRGSCWRCWNQPQKQPVFSDNYQALKRSTLHKESLDKSIYLQKELGHSTRLIQSHAANFGWCQGWNNPGRKHNLPWEQGSCRSLESQSPKECVAHNILFKRNKHLGNVFSNRNFSCFSDGF